MSHQHVQHWLCPFKAPLCSHPETFISPLPPLKSSKRLLAPPVHAVPFKAPITPLCTPLPPRRVLARHPDLDSE